MSEGHESARKGSELGQHELREILHAIREVEANLEHRADRAFAAVTMMWGFVVAGIFAFYHLAWNNPALYRDLFGALLPWVWVGPALLGVAISAATNAHVGRITDGEGDTRSAWVTLGLIVLGLAITAALLASDLQLLVAAFWPIWLGLIGFVSTTWLSNEVVGWWWYGFDVVAPIVGVALFVVQPDWAFLAASMVFALGLGGLGAVEYARAR